MNHTQKGFVIPLTIAIIAILAIGGGVYVYQNKKTEVPASTDSNVSLIDFSRPASGSSSSTDNVSDWKTYKNEKLGFEFKYPSLLTLMDVGGGVTLDHSIPYKHPNVCDFKGDSLPLERLGDFGVSFRVVNQNLKSYVESTEYPGWDYVSSNPIKIGTLQGYSIMQGIEGCGINVYYFTISPNKTLVVSRLIITELSPAVTDYETYLGLPGVISPAQEESYFNQILSTIVFTPSSVKLPNAPVITYVSSVKSTPDVGNGYIRSGATVYVVGQNLFGCPSVNNCELAVYVGGKRGNIIGSGGSITSLVFTAPVLADGNYDLYFVNLATGQKSNVVKVTTKVDNKAVLTQAAAQTLVSNTWGGCKPDTCSSVVVTVENNNGQYSVTAIYEGLRDDSTSATKRVAPAYYSENVWALGTPMITQSCQPGRGHQDFSPEYCN